MNEQQELGIKDVSRGGAETRSVEGFKFEPIRGQPMLRWAGKRPFTSTQYFPAQEKERHGEETDGWMNELYWGDNLQVMSHLLKKYRGRVNLIYIDPPFDSKADYKKTITLRGQKVENDHNSFEEKQYTDIWTNDEYLQFMYERLILCRELLADTGSIYLHMDEKRSHYLKCIMDEVFGQGNFVNEIIWKYDGPQSPSNLKFATKHDVILRYAKSFVSCLAYELYYMEAEPFDAKKYKMDETGRYYYTIPKGDYTDESIRKLDAEGKILWTGNGTARIKKFVEVSADGKEMLKRKKIPDVWAITSLGLAAGSKENLGYPTQKPEALLERIIKASSNPGDLVFDCFMGSGTTQAVAMKLGCKFIGADINLGAIQTTTKRLLGVAAEIGKQLPNKDEPKYTGFTVYNVNNYDVFRNPVEAKDLLVQALELHPLPGGSMYDGEKDEWFYKIMPVNRLATKADLNEIVTGFDYKAAEKAAMENPGKPVLKLRLVCMGHEPDLKASLEEQLKAFKVEIEVVDILRDKSQLVFKRDSEAKIVRVGGKVKIKAFYPMNLLKKLSLQKSKVGEWRELVESVMVDFNYDGAVFTPTIVDVPKDNEFVKGEYAIPEGAGTIRVKITDLLAESLEMEVE